MNVALLLNGEKTGFLQKLEPAEDMIFMKTRELTAAGPGKGKPQKDKIIEHYKWLDSYIIQSYRDLFGVEIK